MIEFTGRSSDIEDGADHVHPFYAMALHISNSDEIYIVGAVAVIGTIFGAIHATGWNSSFPTPIEATIWRICSLIVTCGPFLVVIDTVCDVIYPQHYPFWEDVQIVLELLSIFVTPSFYIIARIYLLTEALIALRNLHPGAFVQVQWTSFLPHI